MSSPLHEKRSTTLSFSHPSLTHTTQLFFITPFKVDFFGCHVSNLNMTYIFSLPEGHWPQDTSFPVIDSRHLWRPRIADAT